MTHRHGINTPKSKLPGLLVDLVDELPGWGYNDRFGLLQFTEGAGCHALRHQLLQNGEQERSLQVGDSQAPPTSIPTAELFVTSSHRFTRPCLGTGHDISASRYDGDGMLLHWSRLHITRLAHIFLQRLTQCRLIKCLKKQDRWF